MTEDTGVNVYINAIDNTAAGTASAARNVEGLAGRVTAADALLQQQMARERQVESMLLSHGITPSAGSGSLKAGQLRSLGFSESELSSLGMGPAARAGGNEYEKVLAGRMAGLGNVANLMGFSGPMLGIGAAALGVGAGASVIGDLVGDYRENEKATRDLTQAYREAGLSYQNAKAGIDAWIDKNAAYIDNVDSAREGFAKLTRANIDQSNVTKAMNDAINLAALKGMSLSDAIEVVLKGAEGQGRQLKDLGINMKDYIDLTASGVQAQAQYNDLQNAAKDADTKVVESRLTARDADLRVTDAQIRLKAAIDNYGGGSSQAKLAQDALTIAMDNATKAHDNIKFAVDTATKSHEKLTGAQDVMANKAKAQGQYFDDLGKKVQGGTNSVDDLQKQQDKLGASMHKLADDAGPALLAALTALTGALDGAVTSITGLFHMTGPGGPGGHVNPSGGKFAGLNPNAVTYGGGGASGNYGSGHGQ